MALGTTFNFMNTMDDKVFIDREVLKTTYEENKEIKVEKIPVPVSSDEQEQNDKNDDSNDNSEFNNQIAQGRADLTKPFIVIDDMPPIDYQHKFVDKDNYTKFIDMKSSSDIITVFVNKYFWGFFNVILYFLIICKLIEIISKNKIKIINFEIQWGLMMTSIVLYIIYRSFNTYSPVKISF